MSARRSRRATPTPHRKRELRKGCVPSPACGSRCCARRWSTAPASRRIFSPCCVPSIAACRCRLPPSPIAAASSTSATWRTRSCAAWRRRRRPVPRTGGIALRAGAAACLALGAAELWRPLALALALAVLSFLDDLRGVPVALRLAAHVLAAGVFAWYLLSPMHPAELAALVLAMVWITNLYNFMDGADGLAGGMALVGFGAYAAPASTAGHASLAVACVSLAAASFAFLLHNFHPARLFLGDVGSIPLGFLAAALGLQGWRDDVWPLWFPALVFGPFIGDATLTLLKRVARREAVWRGDRPAHTSPMPGLRRC